MSLAAVISILLLAGLTLHWAILPHIERWRPQIETRVSRALGVPVRIGGIEVSSGRFVSALMLRDVVLLDGQGRAALQLPSVQALLSTGSLLETLVTLDLRFERLLIEGAHLEVRRDAQGHIFVAGLDFSQGAGGDSGAADWFFKQHEFAIRGGSLRWTDEQRGAPPLALDKVDFVARNSLRNHALQLDATPPFEWGERFSLRGQFSQPLLARSGDWRRWSGQLYADLPRADVQALRRHIELPFELSQGEGALRAWLDWRDAEASGATLDFALRAVAMRLAKGIEPLVFEQLQGRLVGQRRADGGSLALQQLSFLTGDGLRWPQGDLALKWTQTPTGEVNGGELSAERLDLGVMAQTAARLPLPEPLRKLLFELNPHGLVNGLKGGWDGPLDAPAHYRVSARLAALSLAARPAEQAHSVGRPGLRNAEIELSASEKGGEATIGIKGGALDLPGVFDEPLVPLDQLTAHLQWRIEPRAGAAPQLEVRLLDAKLANADAQSELTGSWKTGPGEGLARAGRFPGQLQLDAKLSRGIAARTARYLPLGIPESTRRYVERALRGGTLAGATIHVKGDLWDFPFWASKQGEFRIAAQAEDVTLAYVPSTPATSGEPGFESPWPMFTQASGELIIDRSTLEIRNARGQLYGVAMSNVQGGIKTLADHSVLTLDGRGAGPLADVLRFINATPVGTWTHKTLKDASGSGPAELKLALALPLYDLKQSTVNGSVTLAGGDVRIRNDTPLLAGARGRIDFTHKGMAIVGGSARVLGGDATFDGGTQPDGALRFNAQGSASAEGLRRASELGLVSRVAVHLSGQTPYRLALGFVHGQSEISVTSNLVGMGLDFPPPLRKAAEAPLALRYQTLLAPESLAVAPSGQVIAPRDTLRFELGNVVQASYQRDLSGEAPRVLRGGVGVQAVAPSPASGVAANVAVPSFNVDAWEAIATPLFGPGLGEAVGGDAAAQGGGYGPTQIALRADELSTGARKLSRFVAGLSQEDGLWRANVDADQLNGYAEYRPGRAGAQSAGRIYARLARLSLPKSDADEVENLLDQQAASVPSLDIVVDDFELRGKRLGKVEIEAVNRSAPEREWRLTRFQMSLPEAQLSAAGSWAALPAGGAGAARSPARRRSQIDFTLDLADSGALLERLGSGKTVRGGKGRLKGQVSWLGSPLAIDFDSMSGQVNLAIESGQFLKVNPGAARLLGVLSLQSLPRRLALDFRDVFQEGFAFDNITGDVKITEGVASTNNLRMRGVQAAVLMDGSADIEHETQDLRVVVVPEINAGTASLVYAAINPAIGLGTFLAQLVLRQPLIEAGTREFHVSGPWADPKVERVERKPGQAVPDVGAAPAAEASSPSR